MKQLIGDITLEMSAEDYNPLPDLIVNDIEVEMPTEIRYLYETMEREFFVHLTVVPMSKCSMLRQ